MATEEVAPLACKMASARCTLKSALQTSFQICAVLFDKPRDVFTETLDRLGEGVLFDKHYLLKYVVSFTFANITICRRHSL